MNKRIVVAGSALSLVVSVIGISALLGCQSSMTVRNSDMPNAVTRSLEGEYVLAQVASNAGDVGADAIRAAVQKDATVQAIFKGTADNKDALPIDITVDCASNEANGSIANFNNLIALCTLTIWPCVDAQEYEYTVTVSSVVGSHKVCFKVLDRNWFGLSPLAMIPVPGWSDERGDEAKLKQFHVAQVALAVKVVCAELPNDYATFKKDQPKYLELISQSRSETAFAAFLAANTANAKVAALAKVVNAAVIAKHQNALITAFNFNSDESVRAAILAKLNDGSFDNLPYDPTLISYWSKLRNSRLLAMVYRDGYARMSEADRKNLIAKISDDAVLTEMVTPNNARYEGLYIKNDEARFALFGKVKPEVLVKIFGEDFAKQVSKDKRRTLDGFGSDTTDLTPEAAKEVLKPLSDNGVLLVLATQAKLYSIRYAAIAKISSDAALWEIANDKMSNCPYDTSLTGFGLFGDGLDWMNAARKKSAMNLRTFAIAKLKDIEALKLLRKSDKSEIIKKSVTERLAALGYGDVGEIVACGKYDKDLFAMFAGLKKPEDLTKVSKEAKLKGIRLLAASKLDAQVYADVAKKEAKGVVGKPPAGKVSVGGFYLGMKIEDVFARIADVYPELKPTLYLNDKDVLCLADGNGRYLAWADNSVGTIHWLTLPPSVVKKIVGFKSGSFEDLERAVEKKLGISFGNDEIRKGNVSQKIGNLGNTEGETLRYFIDEIVAGEDISRTIRKAVNKNSVGRDPFAGFGAGLANAFEDAQQADENRANARRPMFQLPGSLQLMLTKNAAKGLYNAQGHGSVICEADAPQVAPPPPATPPSASQPAPAAAPQVATPPSASQPAPAAAPQVATPPSASRPAPAPQVATPPSASQSRKAGETRTVTLPGGVKLELVWCPSGTFTMGSPATEEGRYGDETPHEVTLTRGFWMGKYEVTQKQWQSVMGANPSWFKGDDRPVENVSRRDCQQFCRKVGMGLRLPTEAEWEYACRAGTRTAYFWGDALNGDRANCDGDYPCGTAVEGPHKEETTPVGAYAANAWGLHDMHGNVTEWCEDWFEAYPDGAVSDPMGAASGGARVVRGGSWESSAGGCRSACRGGLVPGFRYHTLGFRVACSAGPYDVQAAQGSHVATPPSASQPAPAAVPQVATPPSASRPAPADAPQVATPSSASRKAGDTKTVTLPGGAKLELVWCPPGTFTMGSPESEQGRDYGETRHRVTLTKGFWMGKFEVTQKQWQSVMGKNPSRFKGDYRPVEMVTWNECQQFCRKAGLGLRLPTEAEWEYACRAGTEGPYAGTGRLDDMGWRCCIFDPEKTHPVGQKKANAWGLYDMHGNVFEWCADWYGEYPSGAVTDPKGAASGGYRVIRGGSWLIISSFCRSAFRGGASPGDRKKDLGFRVVCFAEPHESQASQPAPADAPQVATPPSASQRAPADAPQAAKLAALDRNDPKAVALAYFETFKTGDADRLAMICGATVTRKLREDMLRFSKEVANTELSLVVLKAMKDGGMKIVADFHDSKKGANSQYVTLEKRGDGWYPILRSRRGKTNEK